MRFLLLASPLATCALLGCHDAYSQDPKVAGAYAAAAGSIAVAQAIAAHSSDYAPASYEPSPSSTLQASRDYALRAINRIRADHSLPPLTPSASLSEFAQRGSEWLEEDHVPHHHIVSDARGVSCGESQGSAQGESAAPAEVQIDAARDAGGPGAKRELALAELEVRGGWSRGGRRGDVPDDRFFGGGVLRPFRSEAIR